MNRKEVEELADKIHAHLQRFERDSKINKTDPTYKTRPFFYASAHRAYGPTIAICYVSYQGHLKLTPDEALEYLKWLDDGNIGTHYRMDND